MTEAITIRWATADDRDRVLELADLDGRPAPVGDTLLGLVGGRVWAAVGVDDGGAVSDLFERSEDVVWLLQMRAEQERVMRGPGSLVGRLITVPQRGGAIA